MDILPIAFGILLGMFLTIGDGIATLTRSQYGFKPGLLVWVVGVAVPIALSLFYIRDIAVNALCASTVLSLLLQLQKSPRFRHVFGNDF
jgi:hypothetical protein